MAGDREQLLSPKEMYAAVRSTLRARREQLSAEQQEDSEEPPQRCECFGMPEHMAAAAILGGMADGDSAAVQLLAEIEADKLKT